MNAQEAKGKLIVNAAEQLLKDVDAVLPGLDFLKGILETTAKSVQSMKNLDEHQLKGIAALIGGVEESLSKALLDYTEEREHIFNLGE